MSVNDEDESNNVDSNDVKININEDISLSTKTAVNTSFSKKKKYI